MASVDMSSMIPSLSQAANAGLDPDELLASGDPHGMLAAKLAGVPYQPKQVAQSTGVSNPPDGGNVRSISPIGAVQPAPSGVAAPSTVTPTGTPSGTAKSAFGDIARQQKMSTLGQAQNMPAGADVNALEAKEAALRAAAPNAADAQYKPSVGRRIARGLEGVGLGLAEGGLRGAIAGGIAPQTTGLAGYRDPNSAFAAAQQQNQKQVGDLDQQITQANTAAKQRGEDVKNTTDIAKEYGTLASQSDEKGKGPSLADQYASAVKDAVDRNVDPLQDPKVQKIADATTQLQKQGAGKEANRDDKYISDLQAKFQAKGLSPTAAYDAAYKQWVQETKVAPGVTRVSVMNEGRPVQVQDPNNPDNLIYTTAGKAERSGAPTGGSIPFQSDKALQKDFTSGPDAKTLTSINTAYAHAEQLGKIAKALHNGDIKGLNQLANAWKEQTGDPAPTNFQLLKTALAAEIGKTTSGNVATVEETKEITKAINAANSPDQLAGAAQTAVDLMGSKRDKLKDQYDEGKKGQPNFGNSATSKPTAPTPASHLFDASAYKAKHPDADMDKVTAYAKKQGFTVK